MGTIIRIHFRYITRKKSICENLREELYSKNNDLPPVTIPDTTYYSEHLLNFVIVRIL